MALMEKFFDVSHTGSNFFDSIFSDMQRMEHDIAMMRQQMYQLLPHDMLGGTLDSDIEPRVPIVEERGETKLKLEFNVQNFRPDEVKVKILGSNILQVRAEHEEKSEAGDTKRRLYVRQYSLPKGVDIEHVRPSLTKDGVLTIEAPASSLSPTERLIPIEYKGDDHAAQLAATSQ
jgi:HSP20 family molecular chaperone IbpA